LGPVNSLLLKRASASRQSGEWNEDDYDVLADGAVVGRIFKANAAPVGMAWLWTLEFGYHEDRTPTHGFAVLGGAFADAVRHEGRRPAPLGRQTARRYIRGPGCLIARELRAHFAPSVVPSSAKIISARVSADG
jgi:hypothetical protein